MSEIFIAPSVVLPIISFFLIMFLNKTDEYMLHFTRAEFLVFMGLMIIPVVNLIVFCVWIFMIIEELYSDKLSVWFSKKPFRGD